jgi:RNA polymerase sigma-70 factor (ECF subfamily)
VLDNQRIRGLLLRTAARDEGSAEAFERLYRACAPLLLGVAQRIVRRRELAEEVLHDAFAKIWEAAGTFDPLAAQPVAWMAAIVRNRAIDVSSSHGVSRVESYDARLDEDPEGTLDRLFDWQGADETEDRRRALQGLRECLGGLAAAERRSGYNAAVTRAEGSLPTSSAICTGVTRSSARHSCTPTASIRARVAASAQPRQSAVRRYHGARYRESPSSRSSRFHTLAEGCASITVE